MGYVPPVRDEQSFQYGNRYIHRFRGITPTSPVEKGKFHRLLSDQKKSEQKNKKYQSKNKQMNSERNLYEQKVMREVTKKGYYIDEVI